MVLGLLLAIALLYGIGWWKRRQTRPARPHSASHPGWPGAYAAGVAALALALLGPPARENAASFTAHMVQHLLLTLVAPPLLLLGQPGRVILGAFPAAWRRIGVRALVRPVRGWRALTLLMSPLVATLLMNTTMVVWHLPALYTAAVDHPMLHGMQHGSFFWTAVLFWSLVMAPAWLPRRPSASAVILMLFTTWMVSDLVGATLTLANDVLYAGYEAGIEPWPGATLADQRRGGILMWAGGGALFALCMVGILIGPFVRRRSPGGTVRRQRGPTARDGHQASHPTSGAGQPAVSTALWARPMRPTKGGNDD
jgi:cytochrome c oxidase assembly factor CtaG